jgi:hypothetical protein
MRNRALLTAFVASLLAGLSPLAAAPVIQRGIDVFVTPADGRTYYDFSRHPIPAGFFCDASEAFTGRVTFQGLPLATDPPGRLRGVDTVVERLDDAAFDAKGIATTRLRFGALSLVSISPLQTACGAFHVHIALGGRQRETRMTIVRTQEGGGEFQAPLAVDVKMTFIPVKPAPHQRARKLELPGSVTFPAAPLPWSLVPGAAKAAAVLVDTNGDQTPDTRLPGTSNFLAGQAPNSSQATTGTACSCCPEETCHYQEGHLHCTYLPRCQISCC